MNRARRCSRELLAAGAAQQVAPHRRRQLGRGCGPARHPRHDRRLGAPPGPAGQGAAGDVVQLGHHLHLGDHHEGGQGGQLERHQQQPGDGDLLCGDDPAGGRGDAARHAARRPARPSAPARRRSARRDEPTAWAHRARAGAARPRRRCRPASARRGRPAARPAVPTRPAPPPGRGRRPPRPRRARRSPSTRFCLVHLFSPQERSPERPNLTGKSCGRGLLGVVVEAEARLPAELAGGDHAPQQRHGRVVGVAELGVEGVEDGDATCRGRPGRAAPAAPWGTCSRPSSPRRCRRGWPCGSRACARRCSGRGRAGR